MGFPFYTHIGHLIGAGVVTRDGSIHEAFFEKAVEVGLLDNEACPAKREEFWAEEKEFFQRKSWGQLLDNARRHLWGMRSGRSENNCQVPPWNISNVPPRWKDAGGVKLLT
jgi:hypothetical protein